MIVKNYEANGQKVEAVIEGNKVTILFNGTPFATKSRKDENGLKFFWNMAVTMADMSCPR